MPPHGGRQAGGGAKQPPMVSLTSSTWRPRCPRGLTPSRLSRGRGQAAAGSPRRESSQIRPWSDKKAACFAADEKAGRTRIYECVIAAGKSHNVRSEPCLGFGEHPVVGTLNRGQRVVCNGQQMWKGKVWVQIQGHGTLKDGRKVPDLQGWSLSESRPTGVLACLSRKKVYLADEFASDDDPYFASHSQLCTRTAKLKREASAQTGCTPCPFHGKPARACNPSPIPFNGTPSRLPHLPPLCA